MKFILLALISLSAWNGYQLESSTQVRECDDRDGPCEIRLDVPGGEMREA